MESSNTATDRNLLFGILALQMDFIDRDQLIAAMNAWVLNKAQPLEEILTAHGSLDEDEKALLQAMVAKHLEKHGNNAERSLAAISSISPSDRDKLRGIQDDDIEASLFHLGGSGAEMRDQVPTLSLGRATSEGQRFRVLRPHAKGGLGEVFVASDAELPREVALKQIQEDRADHPESRARFMLEAELTGGLEHPGIVPVYGLGQYGDGRPFYAMRFIRGDSLKEAITQYHKDCEAGLSASEQGLRLRKLLGRFIDVCDAIEYAHSRGVLHRDLKPGNVMLGKYGETLVVDWGLAKAVGHGPGHDKTDEVTLTPLSGTESAPTQMGSALGTPAYMSPEQASGRLDLVGAASDVYSLGATLYSILTGALPFTERDTAAVLRKVQKGEFRAPREVASSVPRALEAICLKAMALAPEHRYSSPRALAEDIEHWLADEPVSAHRDPLLSRAARWARRHRVAVAMVSVLLLTALVSLSIGTILLTGANHRIRDAQALAQKNEQVANENFQLARKAVDDYMTTVSQETLLNEPGMQPLRKKLLSGALEYYQGFVERRGDDPELQLELRDANLLAGTATARIGSHQESMASYQKALKINQHLVEQDPTNVSLRFKLARCYRAIATALDDAGQVDAAWKSYEQTMLLLETILAEHPDDVMALHELRSACNNMGSLKLQLGDFERALLLFERALETGNRLAKSEDETGEYLDSYARTHFNLARLSKNAGDQQKAIEHYRESVEIRERLVGEFPDDLTFRSKLSLSYGGLADCYENLGKHNEAIEYQNRAFDIRQRLARENPTVTEYQAQLAGSYGRLATHYRQLGNLDEAASLGLKANAIWQRLTEQHPEIVNYRESLGTSLYNLGNLHLGDPATNARSTAEDTIKKRSQEAVPYYLASIDVYESLVSEFPDIPDYQASLGNSYNNLGSAYSLLDEDDKCRELNQKAIAVREQLVANNPEVPEYRNQLASTYSNMAGDETDPKKMFELLNKAVDLRQSLVDDFSDVPTYRYKLAFSLQLLALRQFLGGQQAESMPTFRRLIPLLEELHTKSPEVPQYRKMLVQAIGVYAAGQRLTDDWKKAADTEGKTVTIFERLLKKDPQNVEFIVGLAGGFEGVGKCYHKGKDFEQALGCYARSLETLKPLLENESVDRRMVEKLMCNVLEYRVDVFESRARHEEAIKDLSQIIEYSTKNLASRLKRARLRAMMGQYADGATEATKLFGGETEMGKVDYYNAACVFSVSAGAARDDDQLTEEGRKTLVAKYVAQAIDCLRKAQKSGYFAGDKEIESLAKDTDFDAIRAEPAFVEFRDSLPTDGANSPPPAVP